MNRTLIGSEKDFLAGRELSLKNKKVRKFTRLQSGVKRGLIAKSRGTIVFSSQLRPVIGAENKPAMSRFGTLTKLDSERQKSGKSSKDWMELQRKINLSIKSKDGASINSDDLKSEEDTEQQQAGELNTPDGIHTPKKREKNLNGYTMGSIEKFNAQKKIERYIKYSHDFRDNELEAYI